MNKNQGFIAKLKEQFVLGLIVILPLFLTIYIILFIFKGIDNILGKYLTHLTGIYIYGLGFIVLIFLIWFVGAVSRSYVGKSIIRYIRMFLFKTPLFGSVFKGIETISTKVISKSKGSFERVVIVEYPIKGMYALGFMTSADTVKFKNHNKKFDALPVFIPTTPNPTSGFLYFIEKKNIFPVDISVEKAMETVISLGFVHPGKYKLKKL